MVQFLRIILIVLLFATEASAQTVTNNCTAPMFWDVMAQACVHPANNCMAPTVWNGTACVQPANNNCTAPMVWDGIACRANNNCAAPMVWDVMAQACVQPANNCLAPLVWNGTMCVQPVHNCAAPMVWDVMAQACVQPANNCLAPLVWNGTMCVQPVHNCAAPMVWDVMDQACVHCLAPLVWNGTMCVQPVHNCAAPMVWDVMAQACVYNNNCTAPMVWDGIACRANNNCAAPMVWDVMAQACVQPANNCTYPMVWGGTVCIQPTGGVTTSTTTTTTTTVVSTTTTTLATLNFVPSWNLVGNSTNEPMAVASTFNDATKVSTVWKWIPATSKWAFYAPSQTDGGAAYAATKGYDFLTTIGAGEGFWVNAKQPYVWAKPLGNPITANSFQKTLAPGWNLVSTGENKTPGQFNAALGATQPATGIPQNLTTLWTWDNALSNWYFYAPSLEAQGGTALADYIANKGYLDFTANNKTLGPGIGFWVNKP